MSDIKVIAKYKEKYKYDNKGETGCTDDTLDEEGISEEENQLPNSNVEEELQKYSFQAPVSEIDRLNALSSTTETVISDEYNDHVDYIIISHGNRVKAVTHDGDHPYYERDYSKKVAEYFEGKGKNVIIKSILLDFDAPLILETKMLAKYIDHIAKKENVDTISVIGHSKCGAMAFNLPKFFMEEESYEKTSITTIATPFLGCFIASKSEFLAKAKEIVRYHISNPYYAEQVYKALCSIYEFINPGSSHMNNDIALAGYKSDNYDPSFIADMFDIRNINAINKVRKYRNFTTGPMDDAILRKYLQLGDFQSVGMYFIDKYFIPKPSDGFVEEESQYEVEKHIEDFSSIKIPKTSHYFLTHKKDREEVLYYVNNDIDEYKRRKKEEKSKLKAS